jgi:pantoate--beta-alanine ligase
VAVEAVAGGERDATRLRARMGEVVSSEALARLDYAEVADPMTLRRLDRITGEARLLIAAWIGQTRLIDNRPVSP